MVVVIQGLDNFKHIEKVPPFSNNKYENIIMENATFNLRTASRSEDLLAATKIFVKSLRRFIKHITKTYRIHTIPVSYLNDIDNEQESCICKKFLRN